MSTQAAPRPEAYRPDIDGLRAIAVLSVVAYHATPDLLPGGFVGVDVFFVISGFLLTRIIQKELDRRTFSFAQFYLRRARRILPAFFVVSLVTLMAGSFLLTPGELRTLGKHTVASALSVANFAFWLEAGYFANASEFKPMLHTWSLSVEEQFYLFWPWILMAASLNRRARPMMLGGIWLASFVVSSLGVARWPGATFFLLHARAWELLMGAFLALGGERATLRGRTAEMAGFIGLACLVYACFGLDSEQGFPGLNALWPCLGSALLIAAGPASLCGRRVFSARPFVFVGLISYSLYLWHWPVLAIARLQLSTTDLPRSLSITLVLLAFVLAVLSWQFVEKPFRHGVQMRPGLVLARYAFAAIVLIAAGSALYATSGLPVRFDAEVARLEASRKDTNPRRLPCLAASEAAAQTGVFEREPACVVNTAGSAGTFFIWGDSHADALAHGLRSLAHRHRFSSLEATISACPPLPGVSVFRVSGEETTGCLEFNQAVFDHLMNSSDILVVALAARWPIYSEASRPHGEGRRAIPFLRVGPDEPLSRDNSRRVLAAELERTVRTLRDAGKVVLVVGSVPEASVNVPSCLAHAAMPLSAGSACDIEAASAAERSSFVASILARVSKASCLLDPAPWLCDERRCRTSVDGVPLYVDSNHLSRAGAEFVSARFDLGACLTADGASLRARAP